MVLNPSSLFTPKDGFEPLLLLHPQELGMQACTVVPTFSVRFYAAEINPEPFPYKTTILPLSHALSSPTL